MDDSGAFRVVIPYQPRSQQQAVHDAEAVSRFQVVVAHRRLGKTVMAVNRLLRKALTVALERPRVAYIGPTYRQAKTVAWDYVRQFASSVPNTSFNEAELRCDLPNGGQIKLYGADNPDALRGIYLDDAVLDETGLMRARTWTEVVRPALTDRKGSALFIGTPNGHNLFWELRNQAERGGDWRLFTFRASETGILDASELASAAESMSADEYAQEFECSFEASVRGAVYAKELAQLKADGRIKDVPYEPLVPVDTAWDLGIGDSTAIWFVQMHNGEARVIDYYEASGEALGHYVNLLRSKPYVYGEHIVPHDAEVRELGTGKSRFEILQGLGVQPTICTKLALEDGIEAARVFLKRCWFDTNKTRQGVECLQNYRREENAKTGALRPVPVHDWASHGADAFRYAAIAMSERREATPGPQPKKWVV